MKQVGRQPEVLEAIHRHLSLSEEKRRKIRFDYNLAALALGSIRALGSDEFVTDLISFFEADSGEQERYRKILTALGEAVVCPERKIRERALAVMSVAALYSLQKQEGEKIVLLIRGFCRWLEYESEVLPGLTVVLKHVEELSAWLLRMSFWQEAENAVTLLSRIHGGGLEKNSAVRSFASKALEKLAAESIVEQLADGCLQKGAEWEACLKLLRSLGGKSAGFLFKRFIRSTDQRERVEILDLVSECAGETFPGLVEEYLRQEPSADRLKEVIRWVAEKGGESMYPSLQPCLGHEDKRVQHEMIRCVVKIGGSRMRDRLLAGLGEVHESLKIPIIRLLAEHAGGEGAVLSALCDFVDKRDTFSPGTRSELMRAVVIALRGFPHPRSVEVLGSLHREYENLPGSERLLLQIDRSLNILVPQLRHNRQLREEDDDEVVFDSDPQHRQMARRKVAQIEEEVRKILRQGDSEGAGRLLCRHARAAGLDRDFVSAEMLKDRVLQVNPMALLEVVELGRWLEDQKRAQTEPFSSEVWSHLGQLLTPVELQALHRALRRETYRKGEAIIRAGEADETLFFLTAGDIGLNCLSGRDQRFIKRVKPGTVLGGTQFFAASVWTCSLEALSPVQVHLLDREAFRRVTEKYPEFGKKLQRYCARFEESIAGLLKTTGDDRREFRRYQTNLLVKNSFQDSYGERESRTFNGELIDISRNGLAVTVKISGRENARLLLGREIVSVIDAGGKPIVRCSGIVVGVRPQDTVDDNFSIHVKFAGKIDELPFNRIVSLNEQKE